MLARAEAIAGDRDRGASGTLPGAAARYSTTPWRRDRMWCSTSRGSCATGNRRWRRSGTRVPPPCVIMQSPAPLRGLVPKSRGRRPRWRERPACAIRDLLQGPSSPQILTLSFSRSVDGGAPDGGAARSLFVWCVGKGGRDSRAVGWPPRSGARPFRRPLTSDAALTSFLPDADGRCRGRRCDRGRVLDQQGGHARPCRRGDHAWASRSMSSRSRDKAMPADLAATWRPLHAPPEELWPKPAAHVTVLAIGTSNRRPSSWRRCILTDAGPLPPARCGGDGEAAVCS